MFKLLKKSWLNLTLVLVILATVCTATFAWREDLERTDMMANSALVGAKMRLANNSESDPGVLNLTALQEGQTAYIPFQMESLSNIATNVYFTVHEKDADGEEIADALADWDISILRDGQPLDVSEDSGSFVAEVEPAGKEPTELAYVLKVKAADGADIDVLDADGAQLYVTADVRIPDVSLEQA